MVSRSTDSARSTAPCSSTSAGTRDPRRHRRVDREGLRRLGHRWRQAFGFQAVGRVCVESVAGVLAAESAGADRVELCGRPRRRRDDSEYRDDSPRTRADEARADGDRSSARRRLSLRRRRVRDHEARYRGREGSRGGWRRDWNPDRRRHGRCRTHARARRPRASDASHVSSRVRHDPRSSPGDRGPRCHRVSIACSRRGNAIRQRRASSFSPRSCSAPAIASSSCRAAGCAPREHP